MRKINPDNERVKRRYLDYLAAAKGYDGATINAHANAIARFEAASGGKSFKLFHIEQAKAFRARLLQETSKTTGKPLSKATIHQTLTALRGFVLWLADQQGYKRRIAYADADYFRPNLKDARTLASAAERPFPTIEQIRHVIAHMPGGTDIEKRDRALVAFAILTGARDRAMATMQVRDVRSDERRVVQDARHVATKGGKTIETWFFPVGDDIAAIVLGWVDFLRTERLFGETDPLFPATHVAPGPDRKFFPQGLSRRFWTNADPVRRVFRAAFEAAGLPYFNPHSFRKTLGQLGQRMCRTPEEMKAWSQNLGHEDVTTTFTSYGRVAPHRQGELIRALAEGRETGIPDAEDVARLLKRLTTPVA